MNISETSRTHQSGVMDMKRSKKGIFTALFIAVLLVAFVSSMLLYKAYNISSQVGIAMDAKTGEILYEKDAHERIYPASTSKILTAIVAIENSKLSDKIVVSKNALEPQKNHDSNIGLQEGEVITMEDALYGMMLVSGDDAAIAISEHIAGSESNFAKMLNEKVKSLGLKDTNLVTSSGLFHQDHYTTAFDMSVITKYALENPTFKKIYSARSYTLQETNKRKEPDTLYTSNRMADGNEYDYEHFAGGKPGYTYESNATLDVLVAKDDREIILYMGNNQSRDTICEDAIKIAEEVLDESQS